MNHNPLWRSAVSGDCTVQCFSKRLQECWQPAEIEQHAASDCSAAAYRPRHKVYANATLEHLAQALMFRRHTLIVRDLDSSAEMSFFTREMQEVMNCYSKVLPKACNTCLHIPQSLRARIRAESHRGRAWLSWLDLFNDNAALLQSFDGIVLISVQSFHM